MRLILPISLVLLLGVTSLSCSDETAGPPGRGPGPVLPEPFPSCGGEGICTFTISQGRDYTPAYLSTLQKFDYVIVNKNSIDAGLAAAASPDVPVVLYEPLRFRQRICVPDCPFEDWPTVDAHEDWFWHDVLGNRVHDGSGANWHMDYRNTEYLEYLAARFIALAAEYPEIDGVFMDQHGPYSGFITYSVPSMVPDPVFPIPTELEFDATNVAAATYIKARIGSMHMILNSNCYPGFNGSVDGSMDEGFAHDDFQEDYEFRTESFWKDQVDRLADPSAAGKFLFPYAKAYGDSDETRPMRYALASYLLGRRADGYAFFCFTTSSDVLPRYFAEYDTPTGAPVGDYYEDRSGLWVRRYENGIAVVHANFGEGDHTLALDGDLAGTYVDWDGVCYQDSVLIPTNTGHFLLRSNCIP